MAESPGPAPDDETPDGDTPEDARDAATPHAAPHHALRAHQEIRKLRDPLLLAAFGGFSDPQGAAVAAIDHLAEQWDAQPLADLDSESFYDFTVQRPRVRLENDERIIDWPETRFLLASPPGASRDVVLLRGAEPHLRWRTFTEAIGALLDAVGSTESVTLGAQPAAVPHTRPLPVTLSASDPAFEERFGLKAPGSRYQGQTGIVGVLNLHLRARGWRNASLWALAPHYLTIGPNPAVSLALATLIDRGYGTSIERAPLEEQLTEFEEHVREALSQSGEAADYVRQLEEQYDANRPTGGLPGEEPGGASELPPAADLLDDLESFLRERRDDE
ncbi:MAG: PAC2 family protein [Chloroflexi bacterium]|nr:PAC2 family protein [Chloroflexota bacterium]